MPKLLQINVTSNWGSTGKIAEQIGLLALEHGWESYIAYGRYHNPSQLKTIKVGSMMDVYLHYAANRFIDMEGRASIHATKHLIGMMKKIQPDVVQLHNIHDHWMNYPLLFDYLRTINVPVVWTQHDCWTFTGGCGYYSMVQCEQWKTHCNKCPQKRCFFVDRSYNQFRTKKETFTSIENMTLVPVSEWLASEIKKSFISGYTIHTILNGLDVNVFKPMGDSSIRKKYNLGNKTILLAVASSWSTRKGFDDYIRLSSLLKGEETLVLVGLNEKQRNNLPDNIIGIPRTQNVDDLVALYNEASIVLNLSYEETFGLTTVEGFACGTPGIVYNCTASPELITPETGRIVEPGDIEGVYCAILELLSIGKEKMTASCRQRAVEKYDKDKCFEEYVRLYEVLIKNHE